MGIPESMREAQQDKERIRDRVRQSMISGLAIAIPVLVTLFVFRFAVNFLLSSVDPFATVLEGGLGVSGELAAQVAAIAVLVGTIFVIGFVAESQRASGRIEAAFDNAMSSIPGLGSVYSSFNQMSQLLLDSDTQSFQEVKLVEYPADGTYAVAFVTAETPTNIRDATGNAEMTTLYMPMAPNPVMGGFVLHVPEDRVYDVDMTVEEGVQSIVTSGIAIGEGDGPVEAQAAVSGTENVHLPDETDDGDSPNRT